MGKQNSTVYLEDIGMLGRGRNRRAVRYSFEVVTSGKPAWSIRLGADDAPAALVDAIDEWDRGRDYDNPPSWPLVEFVELLAA